MGDMAGAGGMPDMGDMAGAGGMPDMGDMAGGMPGMGDMSGGMPGMGDMSGGMPGMGPQKSDCIGAFTYDHEQQKFLGLGTGYGGNLNMAVPDHLRDASKSAAMLTFVGMIARGPLSPKLSLLWMILIAAMSPLIRNVDKCRAAVKKQRTRFTVFQLYKALAMKWLLVPITCSIIPVAFVVMFCALVAGLYMIELLPIPLLLGIIAAARVPYEWLWGLFRTAVAKLEPKDEKEEQKEEEEEEENTYEAQPIHRFILWMAEEKTFKYYFTCYLHIASVILQLFVLHSSFGAYGISRGDINSHIYRDFFGLSTYDLSVAFAGLDFSYWFDWSFSFPDLSINVHLLLTQIAKMSYSIGLISFLIENVFAVAEDFTK